MSWLRVDDGFMRNRKVKVLSDRAFRLHMAGLCYCAANLTDGALDETAVRVIAAEIDAKRPRSFINELIEAELWLPIGTGFLVNDYLDYNPPAARVKEERDKAKQRMRLKRAGECSDERTGERSPNVRGMVFADPVPSRKTLKTLGDSGLFSLERVRERARSTTASTGNPDAA